MKGIAFLSGLLGSLLTFGILPVTAQITSDNTTNTIVNQSNDNFTILNGIQKGNNLFHSFKEFSITKGGSAVFNNSTDIVNIINRVTGGNISNIDGLIKANGNANLFFINPAGIVFGENASLDIGGSFLGSTAESLLFEDGFNYSAIVSQQTPLLTVSVPLGLQMGKSSGAIEVNGSGHNLITPTITSPINRQDKSNGLQIKQGKTMTLIGGKITFNGGIITAEGGRIELVSVSQGIVQLNQSNQEFTLDYSGLSDFGDIKFLQAALLDAGGINAGTIQVQGKNVTVDESSFIWIQNQGLQPSGSISVNASELLKIDGGTSEGNIFSNLRTSTVGLGKGGDINVSSKQLVLQDYGEIASRTYSSAQAGNLNINVWESVKLSGVSPVQQISSTINTVTYNSGNTGSFNLSTKELTILDGSFLGTVTLASGNAGDVTVNVTDTIRAIGISSIFQPSTINSSTIGTGDSGNLIVNTRNLTLQDGGSIGSSTSVSGAAGSVTVNASESIEVTGIGEGSINPSAIISSANILDEALIQRFGLPDKPFGASGNVEINTPSLSINDGALVSVRNDGFGNGGILEINANSINLDNQGGITAATESGEGGDIKINSQDSLIMRRGSGINTESLGTGNGGNLNINSPVIAGFENSDIIANAVEGNGGNIDITTQGIFGLEFREELSESSDITASSQFGVNGTVEINNLSIDPNSGLVELKDESQQIASGCSSTAGSSFVATGRGGISQNPNEQINVNNTWSDVRDLSAYRKLNKNAGKNRKVSNQRAIVEATGFIRNEKGEIELVAAQNMPFVNNQSTDCSGKHT